MNLPELKGIHHVTAITSSAEKIYDFFTHILGLRLVKKTINQDDINTYHLFFADDLGSPGTDMTFFDFRGIDKTRKGNNSISKTGFRVNSSDALDYFAKRFDHYKIKHNGIKEVFNRKYLDFFDFDEQPYALYADDAIGGIASGVPWQKGPIPNEYAITGLGPISLRVSDYKYLEAVLTNVLKMKKVEKVDDYHLFEMGLGGNGASVIVEHNLLLPQAIQGYGSVHHVAFRVENKQEIDLWTNHLNSLRAPNSGYVDRFYFESLYTRLYPNILFEFATDGPGFIDDEEPYETLGEKLALPPKFRNKREYVESVVRHIDTVRSDKTYQKEYF